MKTTRVWVGVLGMVMLGAAAAPAGVYYPLAPTSGPVIYQSGTPGIPPALRNPRHATYADGMQVQYYRYRGTSAPVTFASANYPDNYYGQYVDMQTTCYYLRSSTGPGGYRMFPAGSYGAQWRGYNSHGYGPWSTTTPFQVTHPATVTTYITSGPRVVRTDTDMTYRWRNNFAPSAHQVQIRRGSRRRFATNRPGVFQNGWIYNQSGYYSHRPSSPSGEFPNGNGYSFRVRSYSPVLGQWTSWTGRPFRMYRGTATVPRLYYRQTDYNGFFNRSPRPFFGVNYGTTRTPALWTYLDIQRKEGSRWKMVRRKWVSRYSSHYDGSATGVESGKVWVGGAYAYRDLKPGTYRWRARAWNGPGARQSRWLPYSTTEVARAGTPWTPTPTGSSFYNSQNDSYMIWRSVPNAYTYNVAVYRNGQWQQTWSNLDPRRNHAVSIWKCPAGGAATVRYTGPRMTTGVYRFRYQARLYGPTGGVDSAWSAPTPDYSVP